MVNTNRIQIGELLRAETPIGSSTLNYEGSSSTSSSNYSYSEETQPYHTSEHNGAESSTSSSNYSYLEETQSYHISEQNGAESSTSSSNYSYLEETQSYHISEQNGAESSTNTGSVDYSYGYSYPDTDSNLDYFPAFSVTFNWDVTNYTPSGSFSASYNNGTTLDIKVGSDTIASLDINKANVSDVLKAITLTGNRNNANGDLNSGTDSSEIHVLSLDADRFDAKGGNDWVYGGDGNDNIIGRGGDDFILGGKGDDYLMGAEGYDTLIGGEGADWFVFDRPSNSNSDWYDKILDFSSAEGDKIRINPSAYGITANNTVHFDNVSNTLSINNQTIAILENYDSFIPERDVVLG